MSLGNFARQAGIPIHHVIAEVAAFPLTAETALEQACTGFHPDPPSDPATQRLWRAAEKHVLGSFPAFSIEEAVAIRDRVWFGAAGSRQRVGLAAYLRRLAGLNLEWRGDAAIPKLAGDGQSESAGGPPAAEARRAWRWMSFALPPDLLLAALPPPAPAAAAHRGEPDAPGTVEVVSATLGRLLADRGFAETHCHIGAALEFPALWVSVLHTLADPAFLPSGFKSPGAALGEGRDFGPWLLRAAVARYVLAAFLRHGAPGIPFVDFLDTETLPRLRRDAGVNAGALLLLALRELCSGRPDSGGPTFAEWQGLYAQLTGIRGRRFPRRLGGIQHADPIAPLLPPLGRRRPSPEMRLVAAGLARLEATATPVADGDPDFAALFWQVVRVRTLFYRHVVQRPMTPGLQWFIRFYGRLGPGRRPFDDGGLLFESAAERGGLGQGLCSLEVRTSPNTSVSALWSYVRDFDRGLRRCMRPRRRNRPTATGRPCEYGLVLHFTKDRGGGTREGHPTAFGSGSVADPDPAHNPSGYRYAGFYNAKRAEALAFAWVLTRYPLTLEVLRGLDICTDELGIPTWVMVPIVAHVRHAGHHASRVLQRRAGRRVPPLGTTVHVGEDFVHLLTGLRRVDEALDYLELREGDRIGHGLALGVDPREWAERIGRLPLTCEDRLFDLAWEWNWYARAGGHPPSGRRHVIEREIVRLGRRIFDLELTPHGLDRLAEYLHSVDRLRQVGFPSGPLPVAGALGGDSALELLRRHLIDHATFVRGRDVEWVDTAGEGEALAGLQAGLRRKVAQRAVTVEVNPSSNLLIGDLQDLTRHPLWRLSPINPSQEYPPVSVCIGSDDPLTFATSLREEYQLLHDALMLAGVTDEEARRWLERTRASGLETRFTLPRSARRDLRAFSHFVDAELPLPP
jgi:hypothetical protein